MTTDTVLIERALWVMAIATSVQALLFVGAAIGAAIAWRRAVKAVEQTQQTVNAQLALLHAHVDRVSGTVEEVSRSVRRGTDAVGDVVTEVRDVVGTVGHSLHNVAAVVTAPRTAMAIGVLRGVAMWRRRRASHRRPALAADVQLSES